MTAALSILTVLAWCLAPAVFYTQINDLILRSSLVLIEAEIIARDTLGWDR